MKTIIIFRLKEAFNALCRQICEQTPEYGEIMARLQEIEQGPVYSMPMQYFGFGMISAFFTLFYGGVLVDAAAAFVLGVLLKVVIHQLEKLEAAGAVHKVNTEEGALYQYCGRQSQGHRDCFLLKCERCGRIRHVDCTHLQNLYDHLEREHHFRIDPRGTLFSGVCDVCAGEEDHHGAQ